MADRSRTDAGLHRELATAEDAPPAPAPPAVTDADRLIARVLLSGLVLGAALLALRVPAVRRVAWRAGRAALVGWLPSLLAREARAAWQASAMTSADGHGRPHTPAAVPPRGPFSGA